MLKKQIIISTTIFCISIFAIPLSAQRIASIYSMFGVGRLSDNSFGINRALGGTGIAFQSGRSLNYLNPASYLGILPNSINMEFGIYGIYNRSDNGSISQSDGDININYFSTNLYINNNCALSLGIVPYSSIDYEVRSDNEVGGDLTSYEKIFKGTGGLSRGYLGSSYKICKGLVAGINASYILGPITQTETAVSNDNFTGYELKNERIAHSIYLDYGLQYSINQREWQYTFGLIFGPGKTLNTIDNLEFTYNDTYTDLEQEDQTDLKIPQNIGLGIAIKEGSIFRAGFDYEWKKWSNINFSNPNFDTKNSHRFSIGMEYSPTHRDRWFRNFAYRLGANYKNSYLEINNTPINSTAINCGLGIPLTKEGMLNLSLEYGEEGTLNNGLIKSNYWMLCMNISLFEFWAN